MWSYRDEDQARRARIPQSQRSNCLLRRDAGLANKNTRNLSRVVPAGSYP